MKELREGERVAKRPKRPQRFKNIQKGVDDERVRDGLSVCQDAQKPRPLARGGTAYAKTKSFEPDVLVTARLAPDQYPLVRQVQSACDSAKFTAAYLAGQKAPSHPDTETTMAQLRARIQACLSYLETVKASDFAGAEQRKVSPAWMQGKWSAANHYLAQVGIPNFYFHVTTAYAILRHNGVALGKVDYIGAFPMNDA